MWEWSSFVCVLSRGLNLYQDKLGKADSSLAQPTLQLTAHLQLRPKAPKLCYTTQGAIKGSHQHKHWIWCIHFAVKCTYIAMLVHLACAAFYHHFLITGLLKKEALGYFIFSSMVPASNLNACFQVHIFLVILTCRNIPSHHKLCQGEIKPLSRDHSWELLIQILSKQHLKYLHIK